MLWITELVELKKTLNLSLPFRQGTLKCCLPRVYMCMLVIVSLFHNLIGKWVFWAYSLSFGQGEIKGYFPHSKTYLSQASGRHFLWTLSYETTGEGKALLLYIYCPKLGILYSLVSWTFFIHHISLLLSIESECLLAGSSYTIISK